MAEWNATIHAARSLILELLRVHVIMELVPIMNSLDGRSVQRQFAKIFNKSSRLSHAGVRDLAACTPGRPQRLGVKILGHYPPPTRETSFAFSSNAAIIASSP